jgi:hypothetical protein
VLEGDLFQCCDLLNWIAGTHDANELKEHNYKKQPTEFITETWIAKENNEWQLKYKTHWSGVNWIDAAHTNDKNNACAGIATFSCKSKSIKEMQNGQVVNLSKGKFTSENLRLFLMEQLEGPKHLTNYLVQ